MLVRQIVIELASVDKLIDNNEPLPRLNHLNEEKQHCRSELLPCLCLTDNKKGGSGGAPLAYARRVCG